MPNEAFCLGENHPALSEVKIAACYFSVKNTQLLGCVPAEAEVQIWWKNNGATKNLAALFDADNHVQILFTVR